VNTHTYTHHAPETGTLTLQRLEASPSNIDTERQRQTERIHTHIHAPRWFRGPEEALRRRDFQRQIAETPFLAFFSSVRLVLTFSEGVP